MISSQPLERELAPCARSVSTDNILGPSACADGCSWMRIMPGDARGVIVACHGHGDVEAAESPTRTQHAHKDAYNLHTTPTGYQRAGQVSKIYVKTTHRVGGKCCQDVHARHVLWFIRSAVPHGLVNGSLHH